MKTHNELGEKILAARKQRGWSQARLASEAGVSENTLLSLENGRTRPQDATLRAILNALQLDMPSAEQPLYEKCRDCHLFVVPDGIYATPAEVNYMHLTRGNGADERYENHEPVPSGMKANLATWRVFGPRKMRERFVNEDVR